MLRKAFTAVPTLLKQDEGAPEGAVRLRFATLNVIDSDKDVTLPGAFGDQDVRMQGSGHNTRDFMIGKGRIHEEGDAAICDHLINLNMAAGREAYEAIKFDLEHGQPLQEWSYVFDIEDSELGQHEGEDVRFLRRLRVHSVDPVFLGAGVGTGTVSVKDKKDKHCRNCNEPVEDMAAHAKDEGGQIFYSCTQPASTFEEGHEQATASLCETAAFIERAATLVASLREKGESITAVKREALALLLADLKQAHDDLDALLKEPEQEHPATRRAAVILRLSELDQAQRDLAGVR